MLIRFHPVESVFCRFIALVMVIAKLFWEVFVPSEAFTVTVCEPTSESSGVKDIRPEGVIMRSGESSVKERESLSASVALTCIVNDLFT